MSQRLAALIALFAFLLLVMGAWLWGGNIGLDAAGPSRIAFQVATGSTEGNYFPVGQAMAGLLSHPAGVARCETATVCGPAGVILSARTSEGAADNLRGVNSGTVDSGLSEGDVIASAVAGQGAFRRGRLRHLRVIASLFSEQTHLVVAANAGGRGKYRRHLPRPRHPGRLARPRTETACRGAGCGQSRAAVAGRQD